MERPLWQDLLLSPGRKDGIWELFHENSKIGRYTKSLPDEEVLEQMNEFHESLAFDGYPTIHLPREFRPLQLSLEQSIATRVSLRSMTTVQLSIEDVAALLHYAYGINRSAKQLSSPRALRVIPSAGALYPLEIYVHIACIKTIQPGLYHYNPVKHHLRLIREGDESSQIAAALTQTDIGLYASLIIFITAVFERSTFKYGDRGYRFILLEAGHVAQNMNLVSNGLGFGSLNIGGYLDRDVDSLLGLDGVTQSTIYMIAIGKNKDNSSTCANEGNGHAHAN